MLSRVRGSLVFMERRDWRRVNEALVRRGEILLDLGFLDGWDLELEGMNKGKEGGRYRYPQLLIKMLGFVHVLFHLPYRQTEGFIRTLERYDPRLRTPDYSTINRRVNRLDARLDETLADSDEDVVIALDASGIKVSNRGDWIRHKWKKRRGYLKIHIAVDVKNKRILSLKVTDERVGDGEMLEPLVEEASKKARVVGAIADGAYDYKRNFRYLAGKGIEPVIRIRCNASTRAGGCTPRKRTAIEYLKDPEGWKRRHGYGRRWMAETVFSSLKRTFGEYVSSRRAENMAREMMVKASLYNLFTAVTLNG